MKYTIIALFCIVYSTERLFAQHIERAILSPAGSYAEESSVGSLSWTLGEIAVNTLEQEGVVTQGFQQYYLQVLTSVHEQLSDYDIRVFPNPASRYLQIETISDDVKGLQLFSTTGKQLYSNESKKRSYTLDLQSFSHQLMILHVHTEIGTLNYKIVKK